MTARRRKPARPRRPGGRAEVINVRLHEGSRVLADWPDRWAGAAKYAREHGAAGVFLANGSYVLIYREGAKLRRVTWRRARLQRDLFP